MDFSFALGLAAGFLLWPWWAMSALFLVFVVDIVCLECEAEGWGTTILLTPAETVWGCSWPFRFDWRSQTTSPIPVNL